MYEHRLPLYYLLLPLMMLWTPIIHGQVSAEIEVIQGLCPGVANAQLKANISGGASPYSYEWSTGSTNASISGVGPGTYSLTVTDNMGDMDFVSITLENPETLLLSFKLESCESPYKVTAMGSGGTPPYKFKWEHTQEGATVLFPEPGTYCVTMTDNTPGSSCGIEGCFTIPDSPAPSVSIMVNNVSCPDGQDGQLQAMVLGGKPPYAYIWNNGVTTAINSNLAPGNYSVTITDSNGCTDFATGTVQNAVPISINMIPTHPSCQEAENGSVLATVSGGSSPFQYKWSNGATTQQLQNLPAGVYSLTVTDSKGCLQTGRVELVPISNLSLTLTGNDETCPDQNDGTINTTVNNGTPPFLYSWSHGPTNVSSVSNLPPGNYEVTVTDNLGCSDVATFEVKAATQMDFDLVKTDVTSCDGSDGMIEVVVNSGTAPFTYKWSNGAATPKISALPKGNYSVTVTDGNGCETNGSIVINAPPPVFIVANGSAPLCEGSSDGIALAVPSGGTPPYNLLWSNGATSDVISNLQAGSYGVTVTDFAGCTATTVVVIEASPIIELTLDGTAVVCDGGKGSVSALVEGGVAPFSYEWSNGANTASIHDLPTGTYGVTVTDANECEATGSFSVAVMDKMVLSLEKTDLPCFGDESGSIAATITGGAPPYSFIWNNGSTGSSLSGLASGSYSVTATDVNGCSATANSTINEPQTLSVTVDRSHPLCNDGTGSINLQVTGGTAPFQIDWSNGQTGASLNNLSAGSYAYTITDANNCRLSGNVTLVEPSEIVVSLEVTDVGCNGASSGQIKATVSGGTPPYAYLWNNGANTSIINNLQAGTYSLVVKDANDCETSMNGIVLTENSAMQLEFNVKHIVCSTEQIGEMEVSITGGMPPYKRQWSNGETNFAIMGLSAGTYTITVTDALGCVITGGDEVLQTEGFEVSISTKSPDCPDENNGEAEVVISGGNPPFQYTWSHGPTTALVTGLSAGSYQVTVTDDDGCDQVAEANIVDPESMVLQFTKVDPTCFGGNDGQLTVSIEGGAAPFTYLWSTGPVTSSISNLGSGSYGVTVTDANGCQSSRSIAVQDPAAISINHAIIQGTCEDSNDAQVEAMISGGMAPYAISWNTGATTPKISNLTPGIYSATVTDFFGCERSTSVTIEGFPKPSCSIQVVQEIISGSDGQLKVEPTGGKTPYDYLWSTGATTATISNLGSGSYSVTVTDANGCSSNCSIAFIPVTGVGDYVWEDIDRDGTQGDDESGISGVKVYLKDDLGLILDSTFTDANGYYYFLGIPPGDYSIKFGNLPGYQLTGLNKGGNTFKDSDADPDMGGMTTIFSLEEGEIDSTWDAGFYLKPDAISTPCKCLNNATVQGNGQFLESFTITSYPGETWKIISSKNVFALNSPDPPTAPITVPVGTIISEGIAGFYNFDFKSVDGLPYTLVVSNGSDTFTFEGSCAYPAINIVELPTQNLCSSDDPVVLLANPGTSGKLEFELDGAPTSIIDPANLTVGAHQLVITFTPDDLQACTATEIYTFSVTNDCFAKLGDFVWWDKNKNGLQDNGEPGIPGVKATVTSPDDPAYMEMTTTDANGMYMFVVPPGQNYKVTFKTPENYKPTVPNRGNNDEKDSDINTATGMTQVVFVDNNEQIFSLDAGYTKECENIDDAGEIGFNQYLCAAGITPEPLVSLAPATGGEGELEYLWMKSELYNTFNPNSWVAIPNSNTLEYNPGPVFKTTYFARCARRVGCPGYLETKVISIVVGEDAKAKIIAPVDICEGKEVTFFAQGEGGGTHISWDFGQGAVPRFVTGNPAKVKFPVYGLYQIQLSVTRNNCTAKEIKTISVTDSPTVCGRGLVIDLDVVNEDEVMVKWKMEDLVEYQYEVEHSKDGNTFEKIGSLLEPSQVDGNVMAYEFVDENPKIGYNYYRVRVLDELGRQAYSGVEDVVLYGLSKLMMVYPNPVREELNLEIFDSYDQDVTIELFNIHGVLLATFRMKNGERLNKLPFSTYSPGTYFLKAKYGKRDVKVIKVLKY